ncbi:hypothetical protein B0J15DRAFT_500864 [Fusarium solani]|uniref:Uncharacterized protein n=1 Tax=Fusarium solani TaxID=169388 RepID=A0A9P9K9F7_FUSSL|nr:uncharacterized protein B0J15DRAFT_500864 [Fusarium solani]KAH7244844.1 hypothetical protein B0J15DRAFT_500864 [Fusarium solani]
MGLSFKESVRLFGDEVRSLNFYVYAQWWLLATLMAEIVTVILLLTGVIEKTYIRPEGDVFIGVISTASIFAIISLQLWLVDVTETRIDRSIGDTLFNVIFWAAWDVVHWVAFACDLPYMMSGACLTVAVACYTVAYLRCHAQRTTVLAGGTGVEYMMMVLPAHNLKGKMLSRG